MRSNFDDRNHLWLPPSQRHPTDPNGLDMAPTPPPAPAVGREAKNVPWLRRRLQIKVIVKSLEVDIPQQPLQRLLKELPSSWTTTIHKKGDIRGFTVAFDASSVAKDLGYRTAKARMIRSTRRLIAQCHTAKYIRVVIGASDDDEGTGIVKDLRPCLRRSRRGRRDDNSEFEVYVIPSQEEDVGVRDAASKVEDGEDVWSRLAATRVPETAEGARGGDRSGSKRFEGGWQLGYGKVGAFGYGLYQDRDDIHTKPGTSVKPSWLAVPSK